jgi:hypothetical protein
VSDIEAKIEALARSMDEEQEIYGITRQGYLSLIASARKADELARLKAQLSIAKEALERLGMIKAHVDENTAVLVARVLYMSAFARAALDRLEKEK